MKSYLMSLYNMMAMFGHIIVFAVISSMMVIFSIIAMFVSFFFAIFNTFIDGVSGKMTTDEMHDRSSALYESLKKMLG